MCTRYTLHDSKAALAAIAKALQQKLPLPEWALRPRFNVSPSLVVPVVAVGADGPEVRGMVWGLISSQRAQPDRAPLINATAERATTAPTFRSCTARRRCLVPVNGYYEWRAVGKTKFPHLFTLADQAPFAFAGIWQTAAEGVPESMAILTTAPNSLVVTVHHRMPVILPPELMARWLGSEPLAAEEFQILTRPLPAERMADREVNRLVNNSRNDGPECLGPPQDAGGEFQLRFD